MFKIEFFKYRKKNDNLTLGSVLSTPLVLFYRTLLYFAAGFIYSMNPIDLSQYKLKLPIEIRFADFDSLAHVNNASYFTYLEEARIKYFGKVITRSDVDWWQDGMILARMEIDFRKPITGYNNYFVYIRCSRLGNKSFDFYYVMTREENNAVELIAEAKSVMVCYDYDKNQTIEMRDDWKEKVKAFEAAEL